jgi:uncharacterized small protein (DUF1192 family)
VVLFGLAMAGRSVAADGSAPTIYKWVDENGIAHYTTNKKRIPRNLRNRIRSLEDVKREQQEAAALSAAAVAGSSAPEPALTPAGDPEPAGAPAFTDVPAPAGTPAPVAAATADPSPSSPPPPIGGPPIGTDIYAVRDAGDDRGTNAGRGDFAEGDDPLFEPEPSEGGNVDPRAAALSEELAGRIAVLEAELAKDERRLKELISGARTEQGKPAPLYGVPELEELARRFPKIQAEIAALRAERRALDASR